MTAISDLVKFARDDLDDQVMSLVAGERQAAAAEAVKGDHRREAEPLVAISQGVAAARECSSAAALASRDG